MVVEELLPDQGVLVAGTLIGQNVFVDFIQKLIKDVVEHQKVDTLRRVFLIDRLDVLANLCSHILKLLWVIPDLVKQVEIGGGEGWLVHFVDEIGNRIALLVAEVDSREAMQWHVGGVGAIGLHTCKRLHWCFGSVALELGLAAHPVCTFFGNGSLG